MSRSQEQRPVTLAQPTATYFIHLKTHPTPKCAMCVRVGASQTRVVAGQWSPASRTSLHRGQSPASRRQRLTARRLEGRDLRHRCAVHSVCWGPMQKQGPAAPSCSPHNAQMVGSWPWCPSDMWKGGRRSAGPVTSAPLERLDEVLVGVSLRPPGMVCPHVRPAAGPEVPSQSGVTDQSLRQLDKLLQGRKGRHRCELLAEGLTKVPNAGACIGSWSPCICPPCSGENGLQERWECVRPSERGKKCDVRVGQEVCSVFFREMP